jgi:hypothetical protein
MKKIGFIGIILCLFIAAFSIYSARQTVAEATDTGAFLHRAFAGTEAEVEGYSIHNWSVIDKEYRSAEQLKTLGTELARTLDLVNGKEASQSESDQASYSLRGVWKNGAEVALTLKSMKFQEQPPQTVLVIRVDRETNELGDYSRNIEQVRETAKQAHAVPQISTCIKGLRTDRMEGGESYALVQKVFQKVKAKEMEGVRSDLVTSISGYSPLTKDYITTDGKKINLQVAVHYDTYQKKTRVLVGSPVVTIEY